MSHASVSAFVYSDIAKMIDHSLLNPTLTAADLEAGCRLARAYDVASVCIMPFALRRCADVLAGSTVNASTTIGFPHGGGVTAIKLAETLQALEDGGQELDMVVNISEVLSGHWDYVRAEIRAVTEATHAAEQKVKVIFENCYLNDEQKIRLCEICGDLGVDWVKTSTGYGSGGATMEDLALMRRHSPAHVQVKAAGGVRTLDAMLAVLGAGATREAVWSYLGNYVANADPAAHPALDTLVVKALAYNREFVAATLVKRAPADGEVAALWALDAALAEAPADISAEDLQAIVYEIGKQPEFGFESLRDWFKALYETLLGSEQGPRMGSFIALYGIAPTRQLIAEALAKA
jgi:deoxyribose-phosphate aldolase